MNVNFVEPISVHDLIIVEKFISAHKFNSFCINSIIYFVSHKAHKIGQRKVWFYAHDAVNKYGCPGFFFLLARKNRTVYEQKAEKEPYVRFFYLFHYLFSHNFPS